jgi:hypothetical protein
MRHFSLTEVFIKQKNVHENMLYKYCITYARDEDSTGERKDKMNQQASFEAHLCPVW